MIKIKENLNDENKNQIAFSNFQKSQKNFHIKSLKDKTKSTPHKEGIYKLLSIIKKLFQKSKNENFQILKNRSEEIRKYRIQYKIINRIFRLYKYKQEIFSKLILKDWISKLISSKKSKAKKN